MADAEFGWVCVVGNFGVVSSLGIFEKEEEEGFWPPESKSRFKSRFTEDILGGDLKIKKGGFITNSTC